MRVLTVARVSLLQQLRNPLVPLLTLTFAPFLVLLIWMFFPSGGSTTYTVIVVDSDAGVATDSGLYRAGPEAVAAMSRPQEDGGPVALDVVPSSDPGAARKAIADRRAVVLVELPADFSAQLVAARDGASSASVTVSGDLTNPAYPVAVILATDSLGRFVQEETGRSAPLVIHEDALGDSATRTEFETYVPGVLIFAIGLMIFGAAMAAAQEVEAGTLHRLALTPLRPAELLGGITIVQVGVGLAAAAVALLSAVGLGFTSSGPLWLALPVAALAAVCVVGLGLIVAALTRTVAQAFLLANFPFGVFMFLSGTMFPVRGFELFTAGDVTVNLLDILPPRHAVNALSAIFTHGSSDIGYELVMLTILSALFYVVGVWLFGRRHLGARVGS